MLHAVTSNHAFRLVFPYVRDTTQVASQYWNALLAAYISIGCSQIKQTPLITHELPTWDELFRKAIQVSDVHVIKFVYTCFRESQVYAEDSYRALAAKKLSEKRIFWLSVFRKIPVWEGEKRRGSMSATVVPYRLTELW